MSKVTDELARRLGQKSSYSCPIDGGILVYRRNRDMPPGKLSAYFLGCINYGSGTCHYTRPIPERIILELQGQTPLFGE